MVRGSGEKTNDKDRKAALRDVRKVIADKFDYQSRRYLLEAIKAQEVIPTFESTWRWAARWSSSMTTTKAAGSIRST